VISTNDDTLSVFDISGHGDPVPIASHTDSEGDYSLDGVQAVHVQGDYAYTVSYADHTLAVFHIDLSGPSVSFVSPTPDDDAVQAETYVEINVSVTESDLGLLMYGWNGTN